MKVQLISRSSDPSVIARALRMCTGRLGECDSKYDNVGESDKALIQRWAIDKGHGSTLEHVSFTFEISEITRAVLQEIARHRISSMSVKSTRYTLKYLLEDDRFDDVWVKADSSLVYELFDEYCVMPYEFNDEGDFDNEDALKCSAISSLAITRQMLQNGAKNDRAKYALPECFATELIWTLNVRSMRNMLKLRTDKTALKEFRDLAEQMYYQIPDGWKFLFEDCIK